MKIITLEQAFAQANSPVLHVGGTGRRMSAEYSQPLALVSQDHKNLVAGIFGDVQGGLPVAQTNAALLAHCYNHLSPVVGVLATILANPRRVERGIAKGCFDVGFINHVHMAKAMEILSQANKVKLP